MAKIHILLLDDNTLFRVMLIEFLEADPSFQVTAECSSPAEALKALARKRVDLVLLDYDLGEAGRSLSFIRQARRAGYGDRIFLMTGRITAADCVSALAEAVCGIFFKHNPPELLVEAIHKVMSGQTWIDQRCIQVLAGAIGDGHRDVLQVTLTQREMQVLKGVSGGLKNRQIGDRLSISEASVKSALQQLFVKTGVRNRTQLVRVALREFGPEVDLQC